MAALPLLKLLCKTCSCSVNPAHYIPTIRFLSLERDSTHSIESKKSVDRKRSYSTPSRSSLNKVSKKGKEQCIQVRKISRSVENLRNYKSKDDNEIPAFRYSKPKAVLDVEDVAANEDLELSASEMEPIESEPPKPEMNFENNVRYELTSTQSTEQNFSDVMSHMRQYEQKKPYKIFPHLQPFNMKPYGSNDTMLFPTVPKAGVQIVYPSNAFIAGSRVSNEGPSDVVHELEMPEPTTIDRGFERDLSSYAQEKEYPGYEEAKKMVVCETPSKTQQSLSRKSYSTAAVHTPPSKPKPPPQDDNFAFQRFSKSEKEPPKPVLRHALLKEVRSVVAEKKEEALKAKPAPPLPVRRYKIGELLVNSALKLDLPKATTKSIMDKVKMDAFYSSWTGIDLKNENIRNKKSAKPTKCGTSEVERPQVMAKKTRSHSKNPTKITYSTTLLSRSRHALQLQSTSSRNLAKTYTTSSKNSKKNDEDCCKQYVTVKLGELQEECIKAGKCRPPKPKTGRLPKFVPADCPCAQDPPLAIGKPLAPLKKRYTPKDPPWTCNKLKACPQPRADDNYSLPEKRLPKLAASYYSTPEPKWRDLKIRRLPKRKTVDPPRVRPQPETSEKQVRADDFLKIGPKKLPMFKPESCPHLDSRPLPGKPLARLQARIFYEKPKTYCQKVTTCVIPRADEGLVLKPKKLPVYKPHDCPSPQLPDMPPIELKRIKWAPIPQPDKICPPVEESPCVLRRADDDLIIAPKKLPVLKPSICPCPNEPPPLPGKPLPRLKPHPVQEKPKIASSIVYSVPRADEGLIAKPKKLPIHKPHNCPCPENRPLPVKPLTRRPRIRFKPIVEEPKVCSEVIMHESQRADDGLVMLPKKLPVHKAQECPSPDNRPPPEKPLPRLKAKPVEDPPKCDPRPMSEDRTVRADEGLTVLPKVLPVMKATCCPPSEPPNTVCPKLARIKFKPVPEPEKINPVPEPSFKIAERADEHDWMYWRKLDVGTCEKKDRGEKSRPAPETSLTVRPQDCLNDSSWLPPVPYDRMTDTSYLSCDHSTKRGYCTSCCHHNTSANVPSLFKPEDIFEIKPPFTKTKPVDRVGIAVYNSKTTSSAHGKEPLARTQSRSGGVNAAAFNVFSTVSRFVSTYKSLHQKMIPPATPSSLQPKKKLIKQREQFMNLYPDDEMIEIARARGIGRSNAAAADECSDQEDKMDDRLKMCCDAEEVCEKKGKDKVDDACKKPLTLWQRIVNFFKAKDCPSPEEFRKMRLREDAEKAAAKAGLCVYDPQECKPNGEKLPKVLTADCDDESGNKDKHSR